MAWIALAALDSSGVAVLTPPSATYEARLSELFYSLRTTHGGPSFVSQSHLAELRRQVGSLDHWRTCAEADERWRARSMNDDGDKRRGGAADAAGEASDDRLATDPRTASLRPDDGSAEVAFDATCSWVMSQLRDPHAAYLMPERADHLTERYHGRVALGVRLRHVHRVEPGSKWRRWKRCALVTDVDARSPAALAGVRVGDELLQVGERRLSEEPHADVPPLDGEEGSRVNLLVKRRGESAPTLLRARCAAVPPASVHARAVHLRPGGAAPGGAGRLARSSRADAEYAAHLRITHFGADTANEVKNLLRRLGDGEGWLTGEPAGSRGPGVVGRRQTDVPKGRPQALLLDLRDNDGGLLTTAIATARLFVPRGSHLLSLQKARHAATPSQSLKLRTVRSYRRRWYHRDLGASWRRTPVVLLVNGQTASAAEVFAAALLHSGRAVLLGEHTFGKGTSQALIHLPDGHGLIFTVYSLSAGEKGAARPLNDGLEPHVPWLFRWPPSSRVGRILGLGPHASSPSESELAEAAASALAWHRASSRAG